MKIPFAITMLFVLTELKVKSQTDDLLLRFPAINPNGSLISFSYQGDIWTVPAIGGTAARLTIHEGYESNPVFSPDGKYIAFSGARYGNNDLFKIPVDGGLPKRLTFHSAADNISSWTISDKILFSTSREFKQIERPQEVYSISPDGGTESRLMDVVGFEPSYSPNGRYIVFVRGDINPVFRHAYKGSSDRDIWIYDTKSLTYQQLPGFETNDIQPQWSGNNTLYFLSSIDGAYNLYRLKMNDNGKAIGKPDKLTHFDSESIRHYSISANGNKIVFEKDMNLYTMSASGGSIQKVNVSLHADDRYDLIENKTITTGATEYVISPNGKLCAYTLRGEVFIKEVDKEKSRSIDISNHAYRDYQPVWLNDSALLFCSDRNGKNFDIYLAKSSDTTEHNIFKSLKHDLIQVTNTTMDESSPVVSNDGKKLAFNRGRGSLIVADISDLGILTNDKSLINNGWTNAQDLKWSPDNLWLAYTLTDLTFNEEVFIHKADDSIKAVNVSMHPRGDGNAFWSGDGTKLGFISERSVDKSGDVYFVWLKKEDFEKTPQDWKETEPLTTENAGKTTDKKAIKPLKIDLENIYQRIVHVTSQPGNESNVLISKDGETFYYIGSNSDAKGRDLYSIKWDGKDLKELTHGGSNPNALSLDREGKSIFYFKSGTLNKLDTKAGTSELLPYSAKLKIDYKSERSQVYEEAWRTIRDGFYDPKFHGQDWNKLHDQYRDRCIVASHSNDFRDMFNYLLGELNSSHQAMAAADRTETNKDASGLLGVELKPTDKGMKVMHVVPGTPADKINSKISIGDIILKVNSQPYDVNENFYALFSETVGEKILLNVLNPDGKEREVIIRPEASITNALYDEWVDERKKMVNTYSKGRLGYIHIKSMDFPSFEVVEQEFTAAGYGKDGIVIDVRYNGGGSTTDFLMTILNYKQHAYTIPRGASEDLEKDKKSFRSYYPTGERLVYAAWTKPSIALCNEGSYSNAEIFSHAYKYLGIGKLVGVPTNGSVISTGGRALMDGSFVRLPFRGWFNMGNDKNQELGPAIPDIIVENEPNWIANGTDDQLKAAVNELLRQIEKK